MPDFIVLGVLTLTVAAYAGAVVAYWKTNVILRGGSQ